MSDEHDNFVHTRYYETRSRIDELRHQTGRLVQMLDDKFERRSLPFAVRMQIEEIERLCRS